MDVAGITHEFGHQFSRRYQHRPESIEATSFARKAPGYLTDAPATTVVQYRANCDVDFGEVFPDYFMTAVLSNQGYTGGNVPNCDPRVSSVGWTDSNFAHVAEEQFKGYMRAVFRGSLVP